MLFNSIKQEVDIKDTNIMEWETEEESFIIKMEDIMKECGEITKWMVGENSIIKEENSLIKEIGNRISFMAMVKYLMTTHQI